MTHPAKALIEELVAGLPGVAEGPWRLAAHYEAGWRGVAKNPSPNKWQGLYEPIPGQELGSRSAIVSVGIKGAEVDDYWLYIKDVNARHIERCSPSTIRTIAEGYAALEAEVEAVNSASDLVLDALKQAQARAEAAEAALAKSREEGERLREALSRVVGTAGPTGGHGAGKWHNICLDIARRALSPDAGNATGGEHG